MCLEINLSLEKKFGNKVPEDDCPRFHAGIKIAGNPDRRAMTVT
jgi:hypothetical protein